jgi:hypothetical protein
VARRRYGKPSPAISTAGQSERPRNPTGDESLAQPIEPRAEYGKAPPESASEPSPHFATGLGEQLRQQQQYAQNDALNQYISHYFGGASPHERQWLRANVHHLQNPMLVHHAAAIALQRGVPRESPEFLHFVGQLLDQHAAAQAQAAPAPPMPPPMPPPAHMHVDLEKTETPEAEPEGASMVHVSAPVSRGNETYSADYEPSEGSRVTLSKAEREHAEAAGVSVEEYGRQKLKMLRMKKSKLIKDE